MSPTEWSSDEFAEFFDINAMQELPPSHWERSEATVASEESEAPWTAASFPYEESGDTMGGNNSNHEEDIFGTYALKRLAHSYSEPLEDSPSTYTPVTETEMQGWMRMYLKNKNSCVEFDPSINTILSTFIGNFSGLATSLMDVLVDNAMSEAINRDSDVVEAQDFTFIDFDFHASNVNPVSTQIRYKLKDLRDAFIEKGSACSSCGGSVDKSATSANMHANNTKGSARRILPLTSIVQAVKLNNKRKLSDRLDELSSSPSPLFRRDSMQCTAKKISQITKPSEATCPAHANTAMDSFNSSPGVIFKTGYLTLTHSSPESESADSVHEPIFTYPGMTTSECRDRNPESSAISLMPVKKSKPRLPSSTVMPPPQQIPIHYRAPTELPSFMKARSAFSG